MAFATVDHHLHLDSVPIVDLRLLTKSELYALSLTSSSSSSSTASHPNRRFDDDVLIPKIDRSVFNESAGSRKQTYSRLRLAPRNSQFASTNSKSALPRQAPILSHPLDQESRQIITLLKQLFPSENQDGDDLFPTPVQCKSQAAPAPSLGDSSVSAGVDSSLGKRKRGRPRKDSNAVIAKTEVAVPVNSTALTGVVDEAKVGNADVFIEKRDGENTPIGTFVLSGEGKLVQSIEGKRKRGRPRKDEIRVRVESSVGVRERKARVKKEVKVEGEMVLVNINDVVVDLDALGNADSTFGEELRKRTEGLETEAQLLGFLEGLQGEWSSARKKRKIVQATELGDLLPKWWKVMLSLKRNGGHKWLVCRRYISPNGQQFVSCKEVSSFLHSYFGLGGRSNPVHTDGNIQVSNKMVLGDDTNLTYEDKNNNHELVGCSPIPIVKSYVKSIEAPGEVMGGMLKKLDPVRSGRFGTSLKIQESVEIDREQTSGTIASYDLSSGFSQGKVNDIMKECFGTYNDESISLSYEEQAMKADKNCFSDGLNDGVRVSISSVDVPKVDIDSASNDMGKEHGADNIDNHQSTSTIEDMKIDDVDNSGNGRSISGISESHIGPIGPENAYSNVDQQSTSEACSLVPSTMIESLHKRGSESGLYSTATDDKTCAVSNDFNNDSFPTFCEPTFDDIGLSGSNDKTISFGRDHGMPDVDSMEISERIRSTGSCSSVPPLDGQSCIAVNNATNPSCTVEELWQEKSFASNSLTSFVNKQSSDYLNKGGIHIAEGPKGDHTKNYNDSELSVSFGSRATGTNADTTSCIEQERSSKGYSLASYANEHASVLENNFVCNSIMEELKQDRGTSETDLVCPSGCRQSYNLVNNVNSTSSRSIEESKEEVKGSWNDEELLDFDSSRGGLEVSAMTGTGNEISSQGPSLVLSEDNQTFATGSGIFSSSVLDDKLIRGSVSGLARPSGSEQTPGFVNNLNKVYSSTLWEQPISEGAEKSRNNEPMTSFLNDSQPSADAMSELLWRIGGQNVQQSGLADTSAFMQSSASYPNFDMLPGKGENEALSVNEKYDNIPGLEGLKSSRLEQFEHDFLTSQANSQSKESNVLSYEGRIEQGFNSSGWPEKEPLPSMPNIASRREINICVWCRNEFYHDIYEAGTQTGSVGFMCANCQGKFSGHVNFL